MIKENINLNLYRTFYELCKYKSFSEASKHTYISQSAISKAIKKLESELDVTLFIRNKEGIELTDKGNKLLFFVEQSFNSLDMAERKMFELNNLEKGKISIGMPSNIGSFYLFDKIVEFHNDYPKTEITIITGSTTKLLDLLNIHEVDFIIDTPPFRNITSDLIVQKLDTFNYCLISKEQINIKQLKDLENKVVILPIQGTENRNNLDSILKINNINLNNILNIHTTEMIIAAVKRNIGIGYVIENLVHEDLKSKNLYKVNINIQLPKTDVKLVYNRKYLTTAPIKFIKDYMKVNMN